VTLLISTLYLLLIIIHILDITATLKALNKNFSLEMSPAMDYLFNKIGTLPASLVTKIPLLLGLGYAVFINPFPVEFLLPVLLFLNAIGIFVVDHNFKQLKKS